MIKKSVTIASTILVVITLAIGVFVFLHTDEMKSVATSDSPEGTVKIPTAEMTIGSTEVAVGIANSPDEWQQGLSDRSNLKPGQGLLFTYPEDARHGIWMKDMNFAIDIIWISKDEQVVEIKENAKPETYPDVFSPEERARYVLEVPAGFAEENDIQPGDSVTLPE